MEKTGNHGRAVEGDLFANEDFGCAASVEKQAQYDFGDLFKRLSRSAFRSKFRLKPKDVEYVNAKGMAATLATSCADASRPPCRRTTGGRRPCAAILCS